MDNLVFLISIFIKNIENCTYKQVARYYKLSRKSTNKIIKTDCVT